jgi:hypothetical protein
MTFSGWDYYYGAEFLHVPPLGVGDGELGNKPVLDVDVLML